MIQNTLFNVTHGILDQPDYVIDLDGEPRPVVMGSNAPRQARQVVTFSRKPGRSRHAATAEGVPICPTADVTRINVRVYRLGSALTLVDCATCRKLLGMSYDAATDPCGTLDLLAAIDEEAGR